MIRLIGHRNGVTYEQTGTSDVSALSPLVTPTGVAETDTDAEPLGTWRERARTLFGPKYKWQTIQLMVICFSGNLCYYGLIYILPETFSEMMLLMEDETGGGEPAEHFSPALNLMLSAVFEIPGVLLALVLSNTVRRKMSLAISFAVVSISCISLVAASQRKTHAMILTSLSAFSGKLFVASVYIMCFLFVLEAYPTAMRSSGLAFCMTFGRLGAFVIPVISELVVHIHDSSIPVFVVLGSVAAIAAINCVLLPDRTGAEPTAADELDSTEFVRDRLESKSMSDAGAETFSRAGSRRSDSRPKSEPASLKDPTVRGVPGYKPS